MSDIADLIKKKLDKLGDGDVSGSVTVVSESDEALEDAFSMLRKAIKGDDAKLGAKALKMVHQICCAECSDDDYDSEDED